MRKRLISLFKEEFKMKKFSPLGINVLTMAITILLIIPAAQAVDFKISGHINRAVLWADNGNDNDTFFVDNENSNSRWRFTLHRTKAGILCPAQNFWKALYGPGRHGL
jgi:hypothetical protein